MSVLTPVAVRRRARRRWPRGVAFGVLLLATAVMSVLAVRAYAYRAEALPGVRLLGADLGGSGHSEASARIRRAVAPRLREPVTVLAGSHRLEVRPGQLLRLDTRATAAAALAAGRSSFKTRAGTLLSPFPATRTIDPVLRLRPVQIAGFVAQLRALGRPARSASVSLEGARPVVRPERFGETPDQRAFVAALRRHVLTGQGAIRTVYRPMPPPIRNASARQAAATARGLVAAPVTLGYRGASVGTLDPQQLARLVRFQPAGDRYVVRLDPARVAEAVRPSVERWHRRATNARWEFSGSAVRVVPAEPGAELDARSALASVTAAAHERHGRRAEVELRAVPADLTTAEANALGIRQPLTSFTTEMGVSSSNRIHNVHLMADYIDGTLIRPGETFSFNRVVGPRTSERGFLEGQMIVGSLVLPSIGGGVCQTATTLFNNAFELGLPVTERHNHNLYISHYPLGRDATVSWGGPDLVFENDLEHGLMIKSSYTDSTLTFTFYGTPQGRRVVSETSPKGNFRSPAMSYAVDPSAPARSVKVVAGTGRSGFDVSVYRTVYERGRVLRQDSFASSYVPEGATTIYGPGRTPPGSYFVIPQG